MPSPTPCGAVHLAHPNDLDLRVIFVEAIMNRTPWRMWNPKTGEPEPGAGTLEARAVLEIAFRDLPGAKAHPGLLHLHVHLMEMSPHPEAALASGDILRDLTKDMGHLTHMPPISTFCAAITATPCTGTSAPALRTANITTAPGR